MEFSYSFSLFFDLKNYREYFLILFSINIFYTYSWFPFNY